MNITKELQVTGVILLDLGYLSSAPVLEGDLPEPIDEDTHRAFHRNFPGHGSYDDYVAHLNQLIPLLQASNVRTIFLNSGYMGEKFLLYHEDFAPFEGSEALNVEWGRGCLAAGSQTRFYEIDLDFSDLRITSKREIDDTELIDRLSGEWLIAGELAPYKVGVPGCLGTFVRGVREDVSIRGISGCIYPLVSLSDTHPEEKCYGWVNQLHRVLYADAVSLEQLTEHFQGVGE